MPLSCSKPRHPGGSERQGTKCSSRSSLCGRIAPCRWDGHSGKHAIKNVATFDLGGQSGASATQTPPLLQKRLAVDLVGVFAQAGRSTEKEVEGLAMAAGGQVYALTDNDNERPTLLLRLGSTDDVFGIR